MTREDILDFLRQHKQEMYDSFDVTKLLGCNSDKVFK